MHSWLHYLLDALSRHEAACLVTVAKLKGSGPREVGSSMVVLDREFHGTIGGGQLEFQALADARAGLYRIADKRAVISPIRLDAQRGQCCGGKVWLAFEWYRRDALETLRSLKSAAAFAVEFDAAAPEPRAVTLDAIPDNASCVLIENEESTKLIRVVDPETTPVVIFGAGHVGRALVEALAPLPFAVTWIDSRPAMFPGAVPANVTIRPALDPKNEVLRAPSKALYLVMTHEHDLDETLCEQILLRGDFSYLGLIGSNTKARRFRMRLEARGVPNIERMVSPIGLPEIASKQPAVIAASVAADLLMRIGNADA